MFNVIHLKGPIYIRNLFQFNDHTHNTRQNLHQITIPHINSYGNGTFSYNGPKFWRALPNSIKSIESKSTFKFKLKFHFFEEMIKTENDVFKR